MRRLMLFTLGFAAVTLTTVLCFDGVGWLLPLALLLPMTVFFFFRGRLRAVSVVLLGAVVGGLFTSCYTEIAFHSADSLCGKEMAITACAESYPTPTRYGASVEVTLLAPKTPLAAILYYDDEDITITPGDTLTATAVLEKTYEEGGEGDLYHPSKGVGYTVSVKGELTVTPGEKQSLSHILTRFSHTLKEKIYGVFPVSSAGYFMALVTGDRSGMDYTFRTRMSLCGLYHAVSLSGMHVSILMGMILLLCGKRRRLAALLGVPTLVMFVLLSGAGAATVRAVVMHSILLFAAFVPREYDPPTALAAALLFLLLGNPWCIAQWGLQLSFTATAGILILTPRLLQHYYKRRPKGKFLRRVTDAVVSTVAVSLSATVFTLPLMILYFGLVSLVAPVVNLLCLWSVTASFLGGIVTALTALASPGAAGVFASVLHGLYVYLERVITLFSQFPLAAVYDTQPYLMAWSVLLYLLLIALFLYKNRWKLILLCLTASFALSLGMTALTTEKDSFTVLSVGQGQSIVLSKGEDTYLIDCGGDSIKSGELAARYLLSRGIAQIDGVILTHFDSDHTAGLEHFLTRVDTDCVYYTRDTVATVETETLLLAVRRLGVKTLPVTEETLPLGQGELRLFSAVSGENDNDTGLCILADTAEYDILVTGDLSAEGELRLLERYKLPHVDILVAGHHGSGNSNSMALLETVRPARVFISVGKNTYGHPAADTLRRIAQVGAKAYTTLENGNLSIRW